MIFDTIDHTTTGVDRLTYKLKQPNIEKLLALFLTKQDELESAIKDIGTIKDIETVTGVWLDYIGKIVGEGRNNLEDEDYRVMLKRRIAINTADGTPDSMMHLVNQFTNSTSVQLTESGMAFGTISVKGGENLNSDVYNLIQTIKPASTRWLVHSDLYDNAFIPAYENNTYEPELLKVTTDGSNYENFQVTTDGTTFNNFYIVKDGQGYYEETVAGYKNTFHYEGEEGDESYPRAKLHWEIDENSLTRVLNGEDGLSDSNTTYNALSSSFVDNIADMLTYDYRIPSLVLNNPRHSALNEYYYQVVEGLVENEPKTFAYDNLVYDALSSSFSTNIDDMLTYDYTYPALIINNPKLLTTNEHFTQVVEDLVERKDFFIENNNILSDLNTYYSNVVNNLVEY